MVSLICLRISENEATKLRAALAVYTALLFLVGPMNEVNQHLDLFQLVSDFIRLFAFGPHRGQSLLE